MNQSDAQYALDKVAQLKAEFQVEIDRDWGDETGTWQIGNWAIEELEKLHKVLDTFAGYIGGREKFREFTGGVNVRKADIGSHGGEALAKRVTFSSKGTFTPWTVVHEFAHAWDAKYGWRLSQELEKYSGGSTSLFRSWIVKLIGKHDSGFRSYERTPGRYGRLPGSNAAGYFYGDKPSGSNWSFNRKEDFAESVAMYVGWERDNDLSKHAMKRIARYQLMNGDKDGFGVNDNWQDYAKYFYPENGDYTKTKRWQFVDDLVNGRISI
ncbi:MAG TPA: hypothetical protein VJ785_02345 [Anaerolineales bacterium]|nr:hypothetical protein [Anaerolineales bacterium]